MARRATGELRPTADGWAARIRIDDGSRQTFELTPFKTESEARERCTALAGIAQRLQRAGHTEELSKLLGMGARARAGKPWEAVVAAVDALCSGEGVERIATAEAVTVTDLGDDWTSGKLHKRWPDHVRAKLSADRDAQLLRLYIEPVIGHLPIAAVTLDDCEQVMASIPEGKAVATRRHVAQVLRRLLGFAVYPVRLRGEHPIPKGWLPRLGRQKAKECLYPDEDRALLACGDVPLLLRLAYGFLSREGMRTDEMARLTWRDVDLVRGKVHLDENKTDEPRDWDLDPGVVRALSAWRKLAGEVEDDEHVFAENRVPVKVNDLARKLRADLKRAGVTRPQLFERSAARQPLRAHDLRATFVTIALATGRTETWVADRTGHKSSDMIARYRRKARGWAGMHLGELDPLDEAVPELAPAPHERPEPESTRSDSSEVVCEIPGDWANVLLATAPTEIQNPPGSPPVRVRVPPSVPRENKGESPPPEGAPDSSPQDLGANSGAIDGGDPVEAALAAGVAAIAASMASAAPGDLVQLADRMASLARELEARRQARGKVIVLDTMRRRERV